MEKRERESEAKATESFSCLRERNRRDPEKKHLDEDEHIQVLL
jgi:hypothetical protein